MGWRPRILMFEADLHDLADAFTGYALHNGKHQSSGNPPDPDFLKNMSDKFPDQAIKVKTNGD